MPLTEEERNFFSHFAGECHLSDSVFRNVSLPGECRNGQLE
jgi:hypothetical protein